MPEEKLYRPNVGIALFNTAGLVLIGRRFRDDGPEIILPGLEWQMPQGGVDEGEDLRQAALRELWEETGASRADYLGETGWLIYEFPPRNDQPAEFDAWRWERLDRVADLVVPFRRDVYREVARQFAKFAGI